LNRLPRVKNFLHNEAPKYQAVTVEWIGGHNPDLMFLDEHQKVVSTHDMAPLGEEQIHALLNQHGIYTHTPKPEYTPPTFEPTAICKAWRQTGGCDPAGDREPMADESCTTMIANGRSGFCECIGKPNVDYVCEHMEMTCEEACAESDSTPDAASDDETSDEF